MPESVVYVPVDRVNPISSTDSHGHVQVVPFHVRQRGCKFSVRAHVPASEQGGMLVCESRPVCHRWPIGHPNTPSHTHSIPGSYACWLGGLLHCAALPRVLEAPDCPNIPWFGASRWLCAISTAPELMRHCSSSRERHSMVHSWHRFVRT